jgi:hypothetical protein
MSSLLERSLSPARIRSLLGPSLTATLQRRFALIS